MIYSESILHYLSLFCFKLILLISLFVLFISITSVQAEPKLEIRHTLEKSSVITGEELRGTVYIKNSGDETLKIRGVSSSCGCTTLRLKQRTVLPEKEVELLFFIDTRGKLGLIEKTITLHTNAADSPHIETIHFHALPEWRVQTRKPFLNRLVLRVTWIRELGNQKTLFSRLFAPCATRQ